jgi:glycosyltransferase involved in cell wall biosynthesis
MRLVAFLQLYNELENGNLKRCLDNCSKWADDIFIYDDCSTDGSQEVYLNYTEKKNIIFGTVRDFRSEIFHKKELLDLVLGTNPDWIGWIDGDTTLCRDLTENCKSFIIQMASGCHLGIRLHNMNLWRHQAYYRMDNLFDACRHIVFWKNTGELRYEPEFGLHREQFPIGVVECTVDFSEKLRLLHYGFSSVELIVKKYLTYKSHGQSGYSLDRLIIEPAEFQLLKVPVGLYPVGNVPPDYDTVPVPERISYAEYAKFPDWESFKTSQEYKGMVK